MDERRRKQDSPNAKRARIELEALVLASNKCVGKFEIDHLVAWQELEQKGMVVNIKDGRSAWYELTVKGRSRLSKIQGAKKKKRAPN